MIALIEEQIGDVSKDEKSMGDNLGFLGRAMDTIIFSRKDTFKEQINRAYASKEDELVHFR